MNEDYDEDEMEDWEVPPRRKKAGQLGQWLLVISLALVIVTLIFG